MKKKILAACLVVCLLATAVIGTTLAYFTDTKTVTNSFTAGNVTITLNEAKVNEEGQKIVGEGAERVQENTYKLYPGKEYDKDPTIHVDADSEKCYLFVRVENGLNGLEAEGATTIAKQMETLGWTPVDEENNVYMINNSVSGGEDKVVFNNFKIAATATADTLKGAENVVVTAYAVQAEGFTTAQEAWNATFGADATSGT